MDQATLREKGSNSGYTLKLGAENVSDGCETGLISLHVPPEKIWDIKILRSVFNKGII